VLAWLSGVRCRLAYGPADATATCFSKIQIAFTFLVPAHPGSPEKRAVKWVCVCVVELPITKIRKFTAKSASERKF